MGLRRRDITMLLALVAVRMGLDLQRLVVEPWRYWDWEDAYNATEASLLWHGRMWGHVLEMQYLRFCGGCTVVSALGAPMLGVFGDRLLAWKAVALLWSAATLLAAWVAVDRWAGRSAAWCAALLFAVPVPGLQDVSLMLWGNHAASTGWILAALALAAGPQALTTGLVLGLGVWFCRTAAYGALVVGGIALARPGARGRFLLGLGLGLTPCLLPAAGGDAGNYQFGPGMFLPDGLAGALGRLGGLGSPARLGMMAAEATGAGGVGAALILSAGAAIVMSSMDRTPRRLVFAGLGLAFAMAVALTGFAPTTFSLHPGVLKGAARFLAPWFSLLALATAAGAGPWLDRGGWRRWVAVVAVGVPLLTASAIDLRRLHGEALAPGVWDLPATEHGRFAVVWAPRSTDVALPESANPVADAALRRIEGWRLATAVHRGSMAEAAAIAAAAVEPGAESRLYGLGQALIATGDLGDLLTAERRADALAPDSGQALGRGEGMAIGARWSGTPLALAQALTAQGGPCRTCAAVGWAAMYGCPSTGRKSAIPEESCVVAALAAAPDPVEAAWGAGLATWSPGTGVGPVASVESALPTAQAAAFEAGLTSPLARISASSSGTPALPAP